MKGALSCVAVLLMLMGVAKAQNSMLFWMKIHDTSIKDTIYEASFAPVIFGTNDAATAGLDAGLGEVPAPPPPPGFYVSFPDPRDSVVVSYGLLKGDLRGTSADLARKDTFLVLVSHNFQDPVVDTATVLLSWPESGWILSRCDSLIMDIPGDTVDAGASRINMAQQTHFELHAPFSGVGWVGWHRQFRLRIIQYGHKPGNLDHLSSLSSDYWGGATFSEVLSPGGGALWFGGHQQAINWSFADTAISRVSLSYSTDGVGGWQTIASDTDAGAGTYLWAIPVPPNPYRHARIRIADVADSLVAMVSNEFTLAPYSELTLHQSDGWNLISVPLDQREAKGSIYPMAVSEAFAYAGGYSTAAMLEPGTGYWLRFSGSPDVLMGGLALDVDTIAVAEGWNLIGCLTVPVPISSVASIPGGLITSEFFGYNGGYQHAGTLEPGNGYWVKASIPGVLILSTEPVAEASRVRISLTDELPPPPPLSGNPAVRANPSAYALLQAFPNPFNPSTSILYSVPVRSHVTLVIYNFLGQQVARLVEGEKMPGEYSVEWNGADVSSGVYYYRLNAGAFTETRKMLFLK